MFRSVMCLAVAVFLSIHAAFAEEVGKDKEPPKKEPAAKVEPAKKEACKKADAAKSENGAPTKGDAGKKSDVAAWIPGEIRDTPFAKRLTELQADLDAAMKERGPAREAADKARLAAMQADMKYQDLKRKVEFLEAERAKILAHAMADAKEHALRKAAFETEQKVNKLEAQVRELSAQLISNKQQPKK